MMDIPAPYQKEQFLREPMGNNAFDYEQRSATHPEPYLRIAPVKFYPDDQTALKNLVSGVTPAFEIYEDEKLKSFAGLRVFLNFPNPGNGAPVYVFDNHNHAFFFWHWFAQKNHLKQPFELIHIDQHKDTRLPATFLSPEESADEGNLLQYTNDILNVGNFIPPAIKTGLIGDVKIVDSSVTLEDLIKRPLPKHYLLDIDLDFFSPDLDYIGNDLKISAIKKALAKASIITIATSPYFIEADLAFHYLRKIFP